MTDQTQRFTLPAGTVCKRGGIPFGLVHDTEIECHPDNWPLILEGFKPSVGSQTLVRSQSLQDLENPRVAQDEGVNATTNNSSFSSIAGLSTSLT